MIHCNFNPPRPANFATHTIRTIHCFTIARPTEHILGHVHHAAGQENSASERASFTINCISLIDDPDRAILMI